MTRQLASTCQVDLLNQGVWSPRCLWKCLPAGWLENYTQPLTLSNWTHLVTVLWYLKWNFFKCILQNGIECLRLVIHWNVSQLVSTTSGNRNNLSHTLKLKASYEIPISQLISKIPISNGVRYQDPNFFSLWSQDPKLKWKFRVPR